MIGKATICGELGSLRPGELMWRRVRHCLRNSLTPQRLIDVGQLQPLQEARSSGQCAYHPLIGISLLFENQFIEPGIQHIRRQPDRADKFSDVRLDHLQADLMPDGDAVVTIDYKVDVPHLVHLNRRQSSRAVDKGKDPLPA